MPIGVLTKAVTNTIIKLPTSALAKPPPSEPGAGVDWVNMAQSKDCKPFFNSTNKIHSKTNKPKAMAIMDRVNPN